MIKGAILSVLFSVFLFGSNFEVNDKIAFFSLPNQFDKIDTIDKSVSTIIVSFDEDAILEMNNYLSQKESNFLKKNSSVFIADISFIPSIACKLFVLPKMRDLKQDVFIIYDENSSKNKKFLRQKDKTTIYSLKNGIVKKIDYVSTAQELDKFLK